MFSKPDNFSLSFIGLLVYASVIFHKDRKGTLRGSYAPAARSAESSNLVAPTKYGFAYSVSAVAEDNSTHQQGSYEPDRKRVYYDPPANDGVDAALPTHPQEVQSYV